MRAGNRIEVTARDLARCRSPVPPIRGGGPVRANASRSRSPCRLGALRPPRRRDAQLRGLGSGNGQVAGAVRRAGPAHLGPQRIPRRGPKAATRTHTINGVGDVKVWVAQELDVSVAGVRKVDYWGAPTVRRHVSGAADGHRARAGARGALTGSQRERRAPCPSTPQRARLAVGQALASNRVPGADAAPGRRPLRFSGRREGLDEVVDIAAQEVPRRIARRVRLTANRWPARARRGRGRARRSRRSRRRCRRRGRARRTS